VAEGYRVPGRGRRREENPSETLWTGLPAKTLDNQSKRLILAYDTKIPLSKAHGEVRPYPNPQTPDPEPEAIKPTNQLNTMKAKNWFFDRIKATNKVRMEKFAVENLEHSSTETTLSFAEGGGVRARMIVDCTGHAKRFCKFEPVRD
jgi:hypothetical protein